MKKKRKRFARHPAGRVRGSLFFSEGFEDVPCGFEQLNCLIGHITSVEGFGFSIVEVNSDGLNVLAIPYLVDITASDAQNVDLKTSATNWVSVVSEFVRSENAD